MKKIGKILAIFLVIASVSFIPVYAETYNECISKCPDASKNPQGNSSCVSKCNTEHNKIDNPDDFWEDTKMLEITSGVKHMIGIITVKKKVLEIQRQQKKL